MPKVPLILVVDDEEAQRQLLVDALTQAGLESLPCANGEEALQHLERGDLMLLDVKMPGMSGLEVLKEAVQRRPELPIILLTAYIDVRDAVAAIKLGAKDYLEKPIDIDELITVIEDFMGIHSEVNGSLSLPEGVVAESSLMYEVFLQAQKVAQTNTTVLLFGESGVGKEIVASFIYQMSNRAADPWTVVDCSTLTENLVESELFGHAKGAFTGAEQARNGRLLQADGGTLFFDEIGELPLTLQPKLLRVLETGSFSPLGSDQEITVDVRFLAATNRNLKVEVEEGRFREDLYYRLNVFPIEIPPLRLRREDIPLLASLILKTHRKLLTPAAERHLMAYDWPGNIRELRNVLERAAILTEGSRILPESLPPMVRRKKELPADEQDLVIDTMAEIERKAIFEALEKTEGNKTKAAELLGISRRSLIYKLRAYEKEGKAKPAPSE